MKKINKKGFYCPSDSGYFNQWTKNFIRSTKIHAPWAHIHVHLFDGTDQDVEWCSKNNVSVSLEKTPESYCIDLETKKSYWVNTRFIRIPELFEDDVSIIAIDSDSLFKQNLPESQFDTDLKNSWVTVRGDNNASLGSAVGFGNDSSRFILREKLLEHQNNFKWFLDQKILDRMIENKEIGIMDLKYSDFYTQPNSYIWTGKGDRKFKKKFAALTEYYKKI